ELCAALGPRIVSGEDPEAARILVDLAATGVERTMPEWTTRTPPDYPRGIGITKIAKPRWKDNAADRKKAAALRRVYAGAFTDAVQEASDALTRELQAGLRAIDECHNAALWASVREAFDYPVFIAAPKSAGITSTGGTGENVPNDLPAVLEAYKAFETWLAAGAVPASIPSFHLPSAV
ncbi:MAG: hypothetical protein ACREC6_15260, partial [Hyphomicrobiaceae bacterium]